MGGVPPLGYRAQDGKLIIVESEAETVRCIFRRYAELGSVRLLKDDLDACSIRSKLRTSASGRLRGGKPFARGALYLMLQNRIYRGEIVHKEQSHPGEHTPIIDQPLWDAVQAYHRFKDVAVVPKPYQKPTPPIRIAASTPDTFPAIGRRGAPIFASIRHTSWSALAEQIRTYRDAWEAAGHPGKG